MTEFTFKGILFDLDGTLVNSIAAVDRAWRTWSVEFGLDPDVIAPQIHGRRAKDSISALAPHLDQIAAFDRLEYLEATDTDGVIPMPGAIDFLARLSDIPWGIVTSGTRAIALPRLRAAGIEPPSVFVTAEQIGRGKPDPEAFQRGAELLQIAPNGILAFEDTIAGVRSAKSAGMSVIALTEEASSHADAFISDFSVLSLNRSSDNFHIKLT